MPNIQIRKLTTTDLPFRRKILIYGEPGAGKSFLAGQAQDVPEMADVLLLDCDGGSSTLLSRGDISAASTRTADDAEAVLWMVANKDPAVASVRTVVLDGLSELSRRFLADLAVSEAQKNGKRDQDANELRDYMKTKNRMLRILRLARDIPTNLVITTWASKTYPLKPGTQQQDTSLEPTIITPDVSNSIRTTLMGLVDDVFYLHADGSGKRYLYTGAYGTVQAKMRDAAVAAQFTTEIDGKGAVPVLINPSMPDLFRRYRAAYAPVTKAAV